VITEAERRFPVRVKVAVPPVGRSAITAVTGLVGSTVAPHIVIGVLVVVVLGLLAVATDLFDWQLVPAPTGR
jgi:hypothetical protein